MKIGLGFRIKTAIAQTIENKLRFVLVVVGMSVSLILFISAYLVIDSVYYSKFDSIRVYKENSIASFTFRNQRDSEKNILRLKEILGDDYLKLEENTDVALTYPTTINEKPAYFVLKTYSVNNNFNGTLILEKAGLKPTKLLEGRGITADDIDMNKKVIVIGRKLATLMFGENALSETVNLARVRFVEEKTGVVKAVTYNVPYTIVGLYDDTELFKNSVNEGALTGYGYIPISLSSEDKSNEKNVTFVYSVGDEDKAAVNSFIRTADGMIYADYEVLAKEIVDENKTLKTIVNSVLIILLLISSVMIGEVMLFAVKERIPEFGIKRALGAKPSGIALDLALEVFIYAAFSYVSALIVSALAVLIGMNILKAKDTLGSITFVVRGESLAMAALITVWMALSAIIFPLVYISKKSIVDTIRFE